MCWAMNHWEGSPPAEAESLGEQQLIIAVWCEDVLCTRHSPGHATSINLSEPHMTTAPFRSEV